MDDTIRILCKGDNEGISKRVVEDLIMQAVVDEIVSYEESREYATAIRASRGLEAEALAHSYMQGMGCRQDPDLAIRWYYIASLNGHYASAAIVARHLADEVMSVAASAEAQKKRGNEQISVDPWIARATSASVWWSCFSRLGTPDSIDTMSGRDSKLECLKIPQVAYCIHTAFYGGKSSALGLDAAEKILNDVEGKKDESSRAARKKSMIERAAERTAEREKSGGRTEGWGSEESLDADFDQTLKSMSGTLPDDDDEDIVFPRRSDGHGIDHVVCVLDIDFPKDASMTTKEVYTRLQQPQKLPQMPDLDGLEADLLAEFPYFANAISAVIKDLRLRAAWGATNFQFRPLLLVGPPGIGKTRLTNRLGDIVNIVSAVISCAGSSDNRDLDGTARGWSSGTPSLMARTLAKFSAGAGLFVFDEVDKTASRGGHNGNILDSLVTLLEGQNCYTDQYLQVPLDLSKCSFVLTANDASHLPMPILSRCRLIECGKPKSEHVPGLVRGIIHDVARDLSVDPRFIASPDDIEMRALTAHFGGTGSVRTLKRGVERLLELRDRQAVPN